MTYLTLPGLVILSMVVISCAQGPLITSPPETVSAYTGQTAQLKCTVTNRNNSLVTWTFLTHDYVISDGDQVLTHDNTKYSVMNTVGGSVEQFYLQILNVGKEDQGFYKCAIAGTDQQIIHHLDVIGIPDMAMAEGPPINMTDCCVLENVSQSCLPGCYPSQIDLNTFNAKTECGTVTNLKGLSKCFTAGSNHDNCCLNMKVDPVCLGFCHNDVPTNISSEYDSKCFTDSVVNGVFTCFEIGFEHLPSEPTDVEAIPVHDGLSGSILVKWAEPKKNPQAVTGYMILYKPRHQTSYSSVKISDPVSRAYRLDGKTFQIESDMDYKIRVSALADHGVSFGSVEVDIYIANSTKPTQIIADVDSCCSHRGVGDACRNLLCHPRTWSKFDTQQILGCYPDLDEIFTCLVGERNHTNCCAAFDVTDDCLPVCSGQPPPFTDSLISCVSQMGIMEACVQQGYGILPGPPTEVMVAEVESTSATIQFKPSLSNNVIHYIVQLKTGNENASFEFAKTIPVYESTVHLSDLRPDTYYWVRIISVSKDTDSLPSETVSFLTYPETFNDPPPTPVTNLPHNMTECCRKSGMPEICWKGCEYRSNITEYYKAHLLKCVVHIGSVLSCGADGRDHSQCCRTRGVRSECVELCAHTNTGALDSKYIVCIGDTPQAVTCFSEGIVNLPRHPDVVVSNVSKNSISLKWEQPKTSGLIDSYIVRYGPVGSMDKLVEFTNKTFYILQDLEPSTQYEITVTSENSNGTSAPSPVITQYTLSDDTKGPAYNATEVSGRAFWQNTSHCCENSMPHDCLQQCLHEQTAYPQTASCITESHKMLACFADGQDHRICCEKGGLSHSCLPLCSGLAVATEVTVATCMSYANRDIILSCFLENKGLIAKPPSNFGVRLEDSKGTVKLEWSPSVNCDRNCTYELHYWKDSQDSGVTSVFNITDTFMTLDLHPGNQYTFAVTVRNMYGSSSPSAWQTLFIPNYERNVKVYLDGSKQWVEQGQAAKLMCVLSGFSPEESHKTVWLFNNHRNLNNDGKMELLIPAVHPEDEGYYTCTVTDSVISSSDSLFLPVKYTPKFKQFEEENAQPSKGQSTSFACVFQGLPDSSPQEWQKEHQPLPQDTRKYTASLNYHFMTGLTTYKLQITDIVEADYGLYSLKVSNAFGSAECHVDLTNPANITVKPPSELPDLKKCCAAKDVSLLCHELCGFHVNATEVVHDSGYESCIPYFETYITCGADGRDHSTCCQRRGVRPRCVPLCSGIVPQDLENLDELLECIADHVVIFACAQEGHVLLPYAPEEVTLNYNKNDNSILISWKAPHSSEDKVEHYNIFYNFTGSPVTKNISVNGRQKQYYIRDIQAQKVYNVWMTAGNKHGSSLPTVIKMLDTSAVTEPDKPVAEEQKSNDVAIGVGVTLGVIAVVAIVILVLFFMHRARLFPPRVSKTVKFENPGYGNQGQIKIHGADESYSYGRLHEDRAPQEMFNVQESPITDEAAADATFENPMFKIQQPSTSSAAATLKVESHS